MAKTLEEVLQHPVFHYFAEISKIPRGSGNEQAISTYLLDFAAQHGLDATRDEALNVVIRKPASAGYEALPTIILQGHMDMVYEKNQGTVHNFLTDPIQLRVVDNMLYATETTLGADNGIAVAYMLALLADTTLLHPALEALITTEEESSMGGAMHFDFNQLKGSILLNIDSEEEGRLLVSCAGGVTARQRLEIEWADADDQSTAFRLSVHGLQGGHSGAEIHKGRGNANKLLGRVLHGLQQVIPYQLQHVQGGMKTNAIPREAEAILYIKGEEIEKAKQLVGDLQERFVTELRASDPEVCVKLTEAQGKEKCVFTTQTCEHVLASLMLTPNGAQSISQEIEGLVESSTNLGVIRTDDTYIYLENEVRSSVASLKGVIVKQLEMLASLTGSELITDSDYPEWAYRPDSVIREICEQVYEKMNGQKPEITAVHAGLECGVFAEKNPNLDMISFGPNIYGAHTPQEHVEIDSVTRIWEYLVAILAAMKEDERFAS
ncbi:aminoacyl-histidine dipeptidase [Brevibacillus laterosporus]|uniref:aminoacyl-histidine dipeptidase n=1 Tax=Brevibacillus laterosporus TaxID=1465 RepID=UPI00215CEC65|nr:aminoacyl-histidine dipeptidase [Brevibacillus laterosporus]MCR8994238.1 aminoacyl-histidine dipeptidase [Brevibacillus laterosporus]